MATTIPPTCGPAPPEAIYADIPTLFAAIQAHASNNRYAFRIRNTQQNRIIYDCDRGSQYSLKSKNPNMHSTKRRNNTSSKKCGYKMRVIAIRDLVSGSWALKILEAIYNHMPSAAPIAYPAHRIAALDPGIRARVISLWKSGASNSQILSDLYLSYPKVYLIRSDIRNITQSFTLTGT
jgi:hypothetical protein